MGSLVSWPMGQWQPIRLCRGITGDGTPAVRPTIPTSPSRSARTISRTPGYLDKVYNEAVDLCVYLCGLYGLTEQDIICHCEGHDLGIASNHADVLHWWPKHGKNMDTFRAAVKDKLGGSEPDTPVEPEQPIGKNQGPAIW